MAQSYRIAFSNDHGGIDLKKHLIEHAMAMGHEVLNLGPDETIPIDYPDVVQPVSEALYKSRADYGVLICGSGIGISIAANRRSGIRAALCNHHLMAKLARQHNDANILVLGQRLTTFDVAQDCLEVFLTTDFEGGRHLRRVEKLK